MAFTSVLPNNYRKKNLPYFYKVVANISTNFFINTSTPFSTVDFNDLVLSIFDRFGNEVLVDISGLNKVDVTGGYVLYIEGMTISGLTNKGIYEPRIYDVNTNDVLLILDCFEYRSSPDGLCYLDYRNSTNIFDILYEDLPDFRNKLFLDFNMVDMPSELDKNTYTEASTGYIRPEKSQLKATVSIETYMFDDNRHLAMQGLAAHDDIIINFREYQVKDNYEIEYNRRNSRSKGTITFYDQAFNEINLHG